MSTNSLKIFHLLIFLLGLIVPSITNAQFYFQQKIVGDRESRAEFGNAVSFNSEYLAVGASRENIASGAVYVYRKQNDNWVFSQKIVPEDGHEMAEFGGAVKLGNNTLVISAGRADIDETERTGALYIYKLGSDHLWQFSQKIIASDYSPNAMLAVNQTSLDFDNSIIVAGAPGENNWSGSVYIFENNGASWIETQKITSPESEEFSNFGIGISVSNNQLIIGESGSNNGKGKAFIYEKNSENEWVYTQTISASVSHNNSYFGNSVSMDGNQVVVGAYAEGNPGTNYASAFIFEKQDGIWVETNRLIGNESTEDSFYGWMTKLVGTNLWIASPHVWGSESGKIYYYQKNDAGTWVESQIIQSNEDMMEDAFGWGFDYWNGELIVSAPRDDFDENAENELQDAGSIFTFKNSKLEINEYYRPNIGIGPNPTTHYLFIKSDKIIESIELYDMLGKKILITNLSTINVSNFVNGPYIVKIYLKDGSVISKKFIKK